MSVKHNTSGTLDVFLYLDFEFANNFNKNRKWKCSQFRHALHNACYEISPYLNKIYGTL